MRWRLVIAFVGVTFVLLVASGIPLARHLRAVEVDRLTAELERDAFLLGGSAQSAIAEGPSGTSRLQSSVDIYASETGNEVTVVGADGAAIVASQGAMSDDEPRADRELAVALSGAPSAGRGDDVSVAVPIRDGTTTVGAIRISAPGERVDRRADDKVKGLIAVGVISLVAAVIAAMFMAGTVVRPLRMLRRATERVASGDLSPPPPLTEGPPEVRQLAAAFTAMTARVAALLEQQRTFAGDASHQLRTPLTALRLQIERAGDLVRDDPEAALERLEAAALETERMQRMVEGLLLLARNERVHPVAVDVATIVRERADVWRPLAEERGIRLDLRTPDHLAAMSTTDVVQQIVDNYIDNALNIAPIGTVVEIVVMRRDEWVEVHVLDRGPGMPEDHLTHAFDRFWRAPTAEHDGSGLGLAIVHHLAERTGSTVALANRLGGGIDASVRMPLASQQ